MKDKNKNRPDQPRSPSRRALLKGAGLVGAGTIATASLPASGQESSSNIPVREALEVLTAVEAEVLAAICERLIPSDEHGPGAREARAVHYIDRSLASHNKDDRESYMVGLNAIDEYARQTRRHGFATLSNDVQDSILLALQRNRIPDFPLAAGSFFNMLRNHCIDGTFCDPYYGGNRNFVGWDMIHYPGVRQSASDRDVRAGSALPPNHQSAYDFSNFTKSGSGEDDDA